MPLNINRTRRFSTDGQLRSLVHAVVAADDADEAHWLEWKSSLDLTVTHGVCHVARAVIGMANRDVPVAAQAAEGYGYIVVGAEPGANPPHGVPPIESHELGARLARYLGLDGPRATSYNIDVLGVNVVVVEVMPPRPGDRPYWFETQANDGKKSVASGTMFVRRQSSTEPANAADMRRLLRRYSEGSGAPRLDVAVAVSSDSLPVTALSDDDIDKWLWSQEQRLLRSLPPADDDPVAQMNWLVRRSAVPSVHSLMGEDPRTEDEFRGEVGRYVNACRRLLRSAVEGAYCDAGYGRVSVTVTNKTPTGFGNVEVDLHLEGEVESAEWQPDNRLPRPPRPFGDPPPSPYARIAPTYAPVDLLPATPGRTFHVEDSGSVTATWSGIDLRPLGTVVLDDLRVWTATMPPDGVVRGQWRASAMNADGICEGHVELAVAGTLGLFDLMD